MKTTELRKLIREEVRRALKEVEDLELKRVAKQIFSVAKKYSLKPKYETKTVKFDSKGGDSVKGYGAIISVANGVMTVGIFGPGVLRSIRLGGFPGVNKNEVSDESNDTQSDSNIKGLNKAMRILFNAIMKELPGDKFETRNTGSKPNRNGYYLIQARPKTTK